MKLSRKRGLVSVCLAVVVALSTACDGDPHEALCETLQACDEKGHNFLQGDDFDTCVVNTERDFPTDGTCGEQTEELLFCMADNFDCATGIGDNGQHLDRWCREELDAREACLSRF